MVLSLEVASLLPKGKIMLGVSPDNSTEHQIDHICINKKFRIFLQDVRVRRGAAGVASDHHLVITRVKLKLKRNSSLTTRRQRYNVSLLGENEKRASYPNRLNLNLNIIMSAKSWNDITATLKS